MKQMFMISLVEGSLEIIPEEKDIKDEIAAYKNIRYNSDDMDTMLSICETMFSLFPLPNEPFKYKNYSNNELIEIIKRIYSKMGKDEYETVMQALTTNGIVHIDECSNSPMIGFNSCFYDLNKNYVYTTKSRNIRDVFVLIHELKHNEENVKKMTQGEQYNFFLELGPIHSELFAIAELEKRSSSGELLKLKRNQFNNMRMTCGVFMANYVTMEYLTKNEYNVSNITNADIELELKNFGIVAKNGYDFIDGSLPLDIIHAMAYIVALTFQDNYSISSQKDSINRIVAAPIGGITELFGEKGAITKSECIKSLKRQYKRLQ